MSRPVLVVLSGRPGVGKTTLGKGLALASGAVFLRVDTIEQAVQAAGGEPAAEAGYAVLTALAAENLTLGLSVVADAVNPVAATRDALAEAARASQARLLNVEVVCSHEAEHRRRVEQRGSDAAGLALPGWAEVQARAFEPWTEPRVVLDTARRSPGEAVALLLGQMDD